MKITVLGAGNMGSAFVKQLTRAGHEVVVTARDFEKAKAVASAHRGALASPAATAAAEAVIVATGFADAISALRSLGDLRGKVVIDITNPLTADYMGLTIGHNTSAAEEIAKAIREADVVKAFNTVFAQVLAAGADLGRGQTVPEIQAGCDDDCREHGLRDDRRGQPQERAVPRTRRRTQHLSWLRRRTRHEHRADLAKGRLSGAIIHRFTHWKR